MVLRYGGAGEGGGIGQSGGENAGAHLHIVVWCRARPRDRVI